MFIPNILITNFCNQSCSYCFARDLMLNSKLPKEMEIKDFEKFLDNIKTKKNVIPIVKLFGGEPTLHSRFDEFVKLALEKFSFVHIFTNGIIPDKKITKLRQYFSRINFMINMQTPGFNYNPKIQKLVIKRIKKLSLETNITLSINIYFGIQINKIVDLYRKKELLRNIKYIRIGASNPIANGVNNYSYNRFKDFGQLTMRLIYQFKKISPSTHIILDCGFVPCMFSKKDRKYIESVLLKKEWGCSIGNIDIDTSLTCFTCYSLSMLKLFRLSLKKMSLDNVHKKLTIKQYIYQNKYIPNFCRDCPYYGLGKGRCSGPCLALNINSKNVDKAINYHSK